MYSEDSEDPDYREMDKEAFLKKTWADRERQFYGEEVDEAIQEEVEAEEQISDDSDLDNIEREVYEKDVSIEQEFMQHINKNINRISENPYERMKKKNEIQT